MSYLEQEQDMTILQVGERLRYQKHWLPESEVPPAKEDVGSIYDLAGALLHFGVPPRSIAWSCLVLLAVKFWPCSCKIIATIDLSQKPGMLQDPSHGFVLSRGTNWNGPPSTLPPLQAPGSPKLTSVPYVKVYKARFQGFRSW